MDLDCTTHEARRNFEILAAAPSRVPMQFACGNIVTLFSVKVSIFYLKQSLSDYCHSNQRQVVNCLRPLRDFINTIQLVLTYTISINHRLL